MDKQAERLKVLQEGHPLRLHWLKKDYVSAVEAVFIYYGIEPIDPNDNLLHPEESLKIFDTECLWEIMKGSDVPFVRGRGIPLNEYIAFLVEKRLPMPVHLQDSSHIGNIEDNKCGSDRSLLEKRPVQLQKDFARTFAAFFWKKICNKHISANALVEMESFTTAMKLVDAGNIAAETHAEWISDLSPRAKKRK